MPYYKKEEGIDGTPVKHFVDILVLESSFNYYVILKSFCHMDN